LHPSSNTPDSNFDSIFYLKVNNGDTIVAKYEANQKNYDDVWETSGKIKFYTIDPVTGPKEVFRMSASRGGNLEVEEVD
jgi:acetamidase/formamidase